MRLENVSNYYLQDSFSALQQSSIVTSHVIEPHRATSGDMTKCHYAGEFIRMWPLPQNVPCQQGRVIESHRLQRFISEQNL